MALKKLTKKGKAGHPGAVTKEQMLECEMDFYFGIIDEATGLQTQLTLKEVAERHGINEWTVRSHSRYELWGPRKRHIIRRMNKRLVSARPVEDLKHTPEEVKERQLSRIDKLNVLVDEAIAAGKLKITFENLLKLMETEHKIATGERADFLDDAYVRLMKTIMVVEPIPKAEKALKGEIVVDAEVIE